MPARLHLYREPVSGPDGGRGRPVVRGHRRVPGAPACPLHAMAWLAARPTRRHHRPVHPRNEPHPPCVAAQLRCPGSCDVRSADSPRQAADAAQAFTRAHAVTRATGVVADIRRLYETIASHDQAGILAGVHARLNGPSKVHLGAQGATASNSHVFVNSRRCGAGINSFFMTFRGRLALASGRLTRRSAGALIKTRATECAALRSRSRPSR